MNRRQFLKGMAVVPALPVLAALPIAATVRARTTYMTIERGPQAGVWACTDFGAKEIWDAVRKVYAKEIWDAARDQSFFMRGGDRKSGAKW